MLDASLQEVENSNPLMPGPIHDGYCPLYYPGFQGNLFLPELTNDSTYYLLHNNIVNDATLETVYSDSLFLSVVVQRPGGDYYLKKKRVLRQTRMIPGHLTAGPHADGQRWWTWALDYDTNRFHLFAIGGTDSLYTNPVVQEIGPSFDLTDLDPGQVTFSPDMRTLALNSRTMGVLLYDFDPSNGVLSNYRAIPYPNMELAEGLVFSPNGRFLYLAPADRVYQMDLHAPEPGQAIVEIAVIDLPDETGWPIRAGYMLIGPDCRIYVSPSTAVAYLHVIHQPNQLGVDCELEVNAIKTPGRVHFFLPNQPMYRHLMGCDSTMVWDIPVSTRAEPEEGIAVAVKVWPNPSIGSLRVELVAGGRACTWALYDAAGRLVRLEPLKEDGLFIEGLAAGWYYWKVRELGTAGKLVVVRE